MTYLIMSILRYHSKADLRSPAASGKRRIGLFDNRSLRGTHSGPKGIVPRSDRLAI